MLNVKNKGANGEREAARLLASWAAEVGYTIDPLRNLEQVRSGGFDLNGVYGLAVEVKRVETPNVTGWWNQTTRQADDAGLIPFLMYRQNRKSWQFRVRLFAAVYGTTEKLVCPVDADLGLEQAKQWFQFYLRCNHDGILAG